MWRVLGIYSWNTSIVYSVSDDDDGGKCNGGDVKYEYKNYFHHGSPTIGKTY